MTAPQRALTPEYAVAFRDPDAKRDFRLDRKAKDEPKTIAELISWYDKNFTRAVDRVRAMTRNNS